MKQKSPRSVGMNNDKMFHAMKAKDMQNDSYSVGMPTLDKRGPGGRINTNYDNDDNDFMGGGM